MLLAKPRRGRLVKLESPRTKIATRRLLFVAKMFLNTDPEYPFSLLLSKLEAEGRIDGGKVKTHYLKQIGTDLEWLSGISEAKGAVTEIFLRWAHAPEST